MKTEPECISCFFSQLARTCETYEVGRDEQLKLFKDFSRRIGDMDFDLSPPELSKHVADLLREKLGLEDPFHSVKKMENERALEMLPEIKHIIDNSNDPLEMAVRFATASNVIDYGLPELLGLKHALDDLALKDFKVFDIDIMKDRINKSKKILIIGDNTGEIIFDRLMLEKLPSNVEYTYAVRSKPILNDSLREDAIFAGIDQYAKIIDSGSTIPGTVLTQCTEEFINTYNTADLIISKGQGNFETLVDESKPIIYLFVVKCNAVASMLNLPKASFMLMSNKHYKW